MDKVFLGSRVSNLDTGAPAARVSRVNLAVDSEHVYTAGDGSGRTVEAVCPWGTQAMADSILASLSYGSFAALNTYMIQDLERRVAALEERPEGHCYIRRLATPPERG